MLCYVCTRPRCQRCPLIKQDWSLTIFCINIAFSMHYHALLLPVVFCNEAYEILFKICRDFHHVYSSSHTITTICYHVLSRSYYIWHLHNVQLSFPAINGHEFNSIATITPVIRFIRWIYSAWEKRGAYRNLNKSFFQVNQITYTASSMSVKLYYAFLTLLVLSRITRNYLGNI